MRRGFVRAAARGPVARHRSERQNAIVLQASAFQPRVILLIPTQEIVLSVAGQSGYLLPRGWQPPSVQTLDRTGRTCWEHRGETPAGRVATDSPDHQDPEEAGHEGFEDTGAGPQQRGSAHILRRRTATCGGFAGTRQRPWLLAAKQTCSTASPAVGTAATDRRSDREFCSFL